MDRMGVSAKADFIKFDPEKIMDISIKLEQQHKRFNLCVSNIQKKSEGLMNNCQSDSLTLYTDKIQELNLKSEEMGKVLLAFSQDLANASGIYKIGETNAKQKSESLPTDGVFLV